MKSPTILLVTMLIISISGFGIITISNSTSASTEKKIDVGDTGYASADVDISAISISTNGANWECSIVVQNNGNNTGRNINTFIFLPAQTHVIRTGSSSPDITFTDYGSFVLASIPTIDPGGTNSKTFTITTNKSIIPTENKFVAFVINNLTDHNKLYSYKTAGAD